MTVVKLDDVRWFYKATCNNLNNWGEPPCMYTIGKLDIDLPIVWQWCVPMG